jgi:tetratricopeptide (TPR) repeat protein
MKNILTFLLVTISFFSVSQPVESEFEKGVKALNEGEYLLADSLLSVAIIQDKSINKHDYLKFFNRGLARQLMDSIPKAILDYDTSIIYNANFPIAFRHRATCHYMYDNDSLAIKDIRRAIELNKNDYSNYLVSVLIYYELKNYHAMIIDCSRGILLKKVPDFFAFRALANINLGDFEKAKKDIDYGKKYFPNTPVILQSDMFYMFKHKKSSPCKLHQEIMTINPNFYYLIRDVDFQLELSKCR